MQTTLTDLLAAFLDHGKSRNMSPVTLRTRRYHIEAFIRRACEHDVYHIERVSRTLLEQWCRSLSSHRTTRGLPLKPRSLNKQIESVRSFITWLSRRG